MKKYASVFIFLPSEELEKPLLCMCPGQQICTGVHCSLLAHLAAPPNSTSNSPNSNLFPSDSCCHSLMSRPSLLLCPLSPLSANAFPRHLAFKCWRFASDWDVSWSSPLTCLGKIRIGLNVLLGVFQLGGSRNSVVSLENQFIMEVKWETWYQRTGMCGDTSAPFGRTVNFSSLYLRPIFVIVLENSLGGIVFKGHLPSLFVFY